MGVVAHPLPHQSSDGFVVMCLTIRIAIRLLADSDGLASFSQGEKRKSCHINGLCGGLACFFCEDLT